jgi:hypothetical protein
MSRTVISPVKKWAGSVTFADPLTFPQWLLWRDACIAASEIKGDVHRYAAALLPGVVACVTDWQLQNFVSPVTADTFPATPRKSSDQLLAWLVKEISGIANEVEDEDPK